MSLLPVPVQNIASIIQSNQAFANPYDLVLGQVNNKIASVKSIVQSATIGSPIYTNAAQILSSIDSIETVLENFGIHTNNLSGVSLSNGLNGANFATISTIVSTVQKYENDAVCGLVNDVFGAIVKFGQIANAINTLIRQLDELDSFPERIANYLDILRNQLFNQIEQDLINFTTAQLKALQYASAAALNELINNPCISEIISVVGTQQLKRVLIPRIQQIF